MQVIIGVDPHKASHTAVAIDTNEDQLDSKKVRASRTQVEQLLAWAEPFRTRTWAIEGADGMGYLLAQQLVASGEHVVNVPATLAARTRVLGSGRSIEDRPERRVVGRGDRVAHRPGCTRSARSATARCCACWPSATPTSAINAPGSCAASTPCCSSSTRAGSPRKSTHLTSTGSSPRSHRPPRRSRSASSWPSNCSTTSAASTTQLKASHKRIRTAVAASGTTLTDVFGIGPIIAAMLIGYTGDITRFANRDRFAAYNGTAPVEFSSGGRTVHRVSQRGNRQLNHALHMAAICQLRQPHSDGPRLLRPPRRRGQDEEGSDPGAEASDQQHRLPPPRRRRRLAPAADSGPGRTNGTRLQACATGLTSLQPALRQGHSRTRHHANDHGPRRPSHAPEHASKQPLDPERIR